MILFVLSYVGGVLAIISPCILPVLPFVFANAANVQAWWLLLAYAAGAATPLAVALLFGGRVFAAMKRSLGGSEWIRRGLGVAVLVGVAAIALGADTGFLTQASLASTAGLEQGLLDKLGKETRPPGGSMAMSGAPS